MAESRNVVPMDIGDGNSYHDQTSSVRGSPGLPAATQDYRPSWIFYGRDAELLFFFCRNTLKFLVDCINLECNEESNAVKVSINGCTCHSKDYITTRVEDMKSEIKGISEESFSIPSDKFYFIESKLVTYVKKHNEDWHDSFIKVYHHAMTVRIFAKREHDLKYARSTLEYHIDNWMKEKEGRRQSSTAESADPSHVRDEASWSASTSIMPSSKSEGTTASGSTSLHSRSTRSSNYSSPTSYTDTKSLKPLFTHNGLDVYIVNVSVTKMKVDGIVNAANERLDHIGGVALHISQAAGSGLDDACKEIIKWKKRIDVSKNVVTTAGKMACKGIIHAVGPRWGEYYQKYDCLDVLADTVKNALETAEKELYSSLAMPAISAGIYGVPKPLCAAMYIQGVMKFARKSRRFSWLTSLYIVDIDDDILQEVRKAYEKWKSDRSSLEPSQLLQSYPTSRPKSAVPQTTRPCSGAPSGARGTNSGAQSAVPSNKLDWTRCPDLDFPGLDEKGKCYELHDGSFSVKIYTGSITRVRHVDAVVCTADKFLSGAGPLSEAVAKAGGDTYKKSFSEMKSKYGSKQKTEGDVYSCHAGDIMANCVVHLVIDQLVDTRHAQLFTYKAGILNGFRRMNKWGLKRIALPLIAGGFVQHDKTNIQKMCQALYDAIMDFCDETVAQRSLKEIQFVNRKAEITHALISCFDQHSKPPSSAWVPRISGGKSRPKTAVEGKLSRSEQYSDVSPSGKAIGIGAKSKAHDRTATSEQLSQRHSKSLYASGPVTEDRGGMTDYHGSGIGMTTSGDTTQADDLKHQSTKYGNNMVVDNTSFKEEIRRHDNIKGDNCLGRTNRMESKKTNTPDYKGSGKIVCASCEEEYTNEDNVTRLSCGHAFCNVPCFIPMMSNRVCGVCKMNTDIADDDSCDRSRGMNEEEENETCVICMDTITDPKKLDCGHMFCSECITQSFAHKPACPVCGKIFGKLEGDQPKDGKMTVTINKFPSLPGYEGYGTIEIKYTFRSGIQKENHPHPGKPYKGTERRAYLPDNTEGQKVLRLLQKAFDSRLVFTIGSSRTTGQEDVVTWNDIHHKTKRDGGTEKFGYPDPTYLSRVQDELAAKGIQ